MTAKTEQKPKSKQKRKKSSYKPRPNGVPTPGNQVERIVVKISRALFAPDGKDHFIIRNEDMSIYADTTDKKIVQRSRWCFEKDYEQYWEADVETKARTGSKHITLVKRIRKNLKWDDYPEEK